jgi:hypothetical protein
MAPINRLIGVVNAFADLAGLDCIPELTGIDTLAEEALAPIDEAISLLTKLRSLIPAPVVPAGGSAGTFRKACD